MGEGMNELKKPKNIDELLDIVGGYGRFQKTINIMFCIMAFPSAYHLMISYFSMADCDWKCAANSTECNFNGTFKTTDTRRCKYNRDDWEYVHPKDYSVVTEFDLVCENDYLLSITTSSLFIGWLFGAIVLGWITDHYGRNRPLFFSMGAVMVFGLLGAFMPNIYAFLVCRFIIGFFIPGTFPQVMFLYISEMIGVKRRAFAGLSIFLFVGTALCFMTLVAYFIPHWKYLYIVSTVPYLFVLFFYKYMPESIRYLRCKGRLDETMDVLKLIAERNGTTIPENVCVEPPPVVSNDKASPLDLFRTPSMACRSVLQGVGYFVGSLAFFALYLGANNISGHLYQDFFILSVAEIPVSLMIMDFAERFGRKHTVMTTLLIGSLMCVGLGFTPNLSKFKIPRIILGMIGKVSISATCNSFQTWTVELYPTKIRGQGMGFVQVISRLGAACAPFVNAEFQKLHEGAADIFIGICAFVTYFLLCFLPETKGMKTADAEEEVRDIETIGGGNELTDLAFENPIAVIDD